MFLKKYYKILTLAVLFMFIYSPMVGYAFLDVVGNAIPQPTYDVPMGMELEKIAKTVQQIDYAWQTVQNLDTTVKRLDKTIENDMNNSTLINMIMGTEDLMDVVNEKNLFKMSKEELEQFVIKDTSNIFSGVEDLGLRIKRDFEEIDGEEYLEKLDNSFTNNSLEIQRAKKAIGEDVSHNDKDKTFEESQKDIFNYYDDKVKNIASVNKVYSAESKEEGSVNYYIQNQNKNIKKSEEAVESKGSNMTVQASINANTEVILELHKTQLEILNAISSLNEQINTMRELYTKDKMEEDLYNDAQQYHKR